MPPLWTERSIDGNSKCSLCAKVSPNREWIHINETTFALYKPEDGYIDPCVADYVIGIDRANALHDERCPAAIFARMHPREENLKSRSPMRRMAAQSPDMLIAEIERLRADVETARANHKYASEALDAATQEIQRLRAIVAEAERGPRIWHEAQDKIKTERDALRADNARLRKALKALLELGRKDTSNPKYDGYYEMARAALDGKSS